MKKTNFLLVAGLLVFALSGWSVYAHGTDTGMSGSMGMMKMMDLMHDHMDENQAFDCDKASDMEMMEEGEEMMEEMMGHEDHERIEEAMEVDMQDHDSLHMMMGMWSSGCVGDETFGTLATHYNSDGGMMGPGMVQNNWGYGMGGFGFVTSALIWIILVLAIIGLWRWIKGPTKPATPIV